VYPFGFKQLLSVHGRCFFPAQDGDVLASLNELPWLKGMNVVCLRKGLKKIGHFLGGSPHKRRNIMPAESCVCLLNDIKEIEVDLSEDKPHLDVAMPYSSSGAQTTVGII
jgi:hypothetical protein